MQYATLGRETQLLYVTSELPLCLSCGVAVAKNKMASPQQRAQIFVWYAVTNSFVTV
jgi:hypothetical protein